MKTEESDAIKLHLSKDKKMKKLIDSIEMPHHNKQEDLYESLIKAIVSQQLSTKAAQTIHNRFLLLFDNIHPHPELLVNFDVERLRSAGLSYQKAGYLRNIAQFAIEETLEYKKLKHLPDEDLVEFLTKIKGVGRWTVEMILMFNLQRNDILPLDDLGIQNAMKKLYGYEELKGKELKAAMLKTAKKWQPYRSIASKYLWRWKDQ